MCARERETVKRWLGIPWERERSSSRDVEFFFFCYSTQPTAVHSFFSVFRRWMLRQTSNIGQERRRANVEMKRKADTRKVFNNISPALSPALFIIVGFALTPQEACLSSTTQPIRSTSRAMKKKCFRMKFFHLQVSVSFRLSISWVVFFNFTARVEEIVYIFFTSSSAGSVSSSIEVVKEEKTSKRNFLLTEEEKNK